ncbi:aspartate carbamoyltransferase [candidate division WS5 bacterium]|uniref:Aspartate carbamoyltransferase n=1 Tax=candidate division WS5 bacterium TaxID=2093353 RepID=A0A419DAM5_9BACT|nr:MAG: aspartate carbamoyltransferase [candidate division WS5 bacterium]
MVGKDIISISQFDRESLERVYEISFFIEEKIKRGEELDILRGRILASLFFEPSTRTRFSFESAMERLGGSVISTTGVTFSSMAKGETLEDTIKTIERYADVIVIRHPEEGSAQIAADHSKKPVINAGDGAGEHPTQALLDYYTIRKEKGKIIGLKIALVGDLKNGRTIHSLLMLLAKYENVEFYLVSPDKLKIPEKYIEILEKQGLVFKETANLEEVLPKIDVLYMTRIQKERFEKKDEYEKLKNSFILCKKMLEKAKNDMVIMHPLPRVNEISVEVDSDSRAKYFDQVENGLYIRMALFALVLGAVDIKEKVFA